MTSLRYEEKRQIFERHFLLSKLSGDETDTLLNYARVERYPAGREIFCKGDAGSSMMAVLCGTLKMSSVSSEGKEVVFNLMSPGDCFGEIALLAVAMTDCELLVFNRGDLVPILEKRTDICLILLKVLCQRLRQTTEQVGGRAVSPSRSTDRKSAVTSRGGRQPAQRPGPSCRPSPFATRARKHRGWQPREREQNSTDLA
jgi:CRP-like cAMP-binding protein